MNKTILSFKRKAYEDTINLPVKNKFRTLKAKKPPMRFNLYESNKQDNEEFYLDGNKNITTLNDCDFEEVQEHIINDVAKIDDKKINYKIFNK